MTVLQRCGNSHSGHIDAVSGTQVSRAPCLARNPSSSNIPGLRTHEWCNDSGIVSLKRPAGDASLLTSGEQVLPARIGWRFCVRSEYGCVYTQADSARRRGFWTLDKVEQGGATVDGVEVRRCFDSPCSWLVFSGQHPRLALMMVRICPDRATG